MTATQSAPSSSTAPIGARLHLFTVDEYLRMAAAGVLDEDDPVELIEGLLSIKSDIVPPYGVPVGIPPDILWTPPRLSGNHPLRRLTVPEYERLVQANILNPA